MFIIYTLASFSYCVKSVRIRSYSGPHFFAFGLNTERYSVSLRIQSECGKMWTRITPNVDAFYAVSDLILSAIKYVNSGPDKLFIYKRISNTFIKQLASVDQTTSSCLLQHPHSQGGK